MNRRKCGFKIWIRYIIYSMTYLNEFKILHEYEYVSVKNVRALKMKYEDLIVVVLNMIDSCSTLNDVICYVYEISDLVEINEESLMMLKRIAFDLKIYETDFVFERMKKFYKEIYN